MAIDASMESMSTQAMISDLYQSIDDDFVTLKNYVSKLNLSREEKFFFENFCEIVENLENQSPISLKYFKTAHSFLEDQVIRMRRANLFRGNLNQISKYVSRIQQYIDQFESVHRQMGVEESVELKVLFVEKSPLKQTLSKENLDPFFLIDFEHDGICALDKYINKEYDVIVISSEILGIDSVSLMKCIESTESVNKNCLKIFINIDELAEDLNENSFLKIKSDEHTDFSIKRAITNWAKASSK